MTTRTLLLTLLLSGPAAAQAPWIHEVHHSNVGPDRGEGVELAGPAGLALDGYRLTMYSGFGHPYPAGGTTYTDGIPSVLLSGSLPHEHAGIGSLWVPVSSLRGGCQGLALSDPEGRVVEFLSYGGCRFNALSGPVTAWAEATVPGGSAASHPDSLSWSTPLRGARWHVPTEGPSTPEGLSLQRLGPPGSPNDRWVGPIIATPGTLSVAAGPAPPGWHGGTTPPPYTRLCSPTPNPVRGGAPLRLPILPGHRATRAEVIDALGRTVLRLVPPPGEAPFVIDTAPLPAGTYVVRLGGLASPRSCLAIVQ